MIKTESQAETEGSTTRTADQILGTKAFMRGWTAKHVEPDERSARAGATRWAIRDISKATQDRATSFAKERGRTLGDLVETALIAFMELCEANIEPARFLDEVSVIKDRLDRIEALTNAKRKGPLSESEQTIVLERFVSTNDELTAIAQGIGRESNGSVSDFTLAWRLDLIRAERDAGRAGLGQKGPKDTAGLPALLSEHGIHSGRLDLFQKAIGIEHRREKEKAAS